MIRDSFERALGDAGKSAVGTKCLSKGTTLDLALPRIERHADISLNSEENKMGMRASYKHFAVTRLFLPTDSFSATEDDL